jgi:hypothetical protein
MLDHGGEGGGGGGGDRNDMTSAGTEGTVVSRNVMTRGPGESGAAAPSCAPGSGFRTI